MSRLRWSFSVQQLLLLTALCGLCAGVIASSRQAVWDSQWARLQFSPDGRWLAEFMEDGQLRVWDLERRRLYARVRIPSGDSGLDFQDARLLDQDTLIVLRQSTTPETGAELVRWDIRRNRALSMIPVSPGCQQYVVSTTANLAVFFLPSESEEGKRWGIFEFWDLVSGELRRVLEVDFCVSRFILSGDGKMLAVSTDLGFNGPYQVHVLDTLAGVCHRPRVPMYARYLDLSDDGRHLISWTREGFVIWDIVADRQVRNLGTLYDLRWIPGFSRGGQWVFLAPISGRVGIELQTIDDGSEPDGFSGSELANARMIRILADSPDGRWIITYYYHDARAAVWDAQTFAYVGDLYWDGRALAGVGYTLGLIGWAAVWGWLARRRWARRKPPAQTGQHVPAAPRRLRVLWGLLWLGGLLAVLWSVYLTLYWGEIFWYVSVLGIPSGAYAMTRWTGTESQGLLSAALLVAMNLILGNLPSCLIGLTAAWQYRHPRVREYLRMLA